jgi:hypothetical protein
VRATFVVREIWQQKEEAVEGTGGCKKALCDSEKECVLDMMLMLDALWD